MACSEAAGLKRFTRPFKAYYKKKKYRIKSDTVKSFVTAQNSKAMKKKGICNRLDLLSCKGNAIAVVR